LACWWSISVVRHLEDELQADGLTSAELRLAGFDV
jgi:hypothetical protein